MKRSKSQSPEPSSSIIIKKSKTDTATSEKYRNLLNFSDDVLLHICKYLSPFDLLALYYTCNRLSHLCCDRTLWNELDLRDQSLCLEDLEEYYKFLQPSTKFIAVYGKINSNVLSELQLDFFKTIVKKCSQLEKLIIENYKISQEKIRISDFPRMLELLSLKGCDIKLITQKSYLFQINIFMPNLTCLILSNCKWVKAQAFMVISKIQKLKELRLNSCYGIGECLAYTSLATRFGLQSLEVLDLRDTFLGDSEISCFSSSTSLKEIYLECPNSEVERLVEEQPHNREVVTIRIDVAGNQILENQPIELVDEYNSGHYLLTDRAICTLGNYISNRRIIHNTRNGFQVMEGEKSTLNNPNLKKVVVRNYAGITNETLKYLTTNVSTLEYLDVSGTSVTEDAVNDFKIQRPNVIIVSSFDQI